MKKRRRWLEENKLHLAHWFTVDDLNHLKRGGRVSGAAAFFGTMLNIKPVLHVDDAGHLIPMEKVRGRKAEPGRAGQRIWTRTHRGPGAPNTGVHQPRGLPCGRGICSGPGPRAPSASSRISASIPSARSSAAIQAPAQWRFSILAARVDKILEV